ncbi:MAG: protein kinase domain-containing protein [Trebonia sp.]
MSPQPLGSRYLLDDPIGQGGMGVVWRGRDREIGDSCAIKVLRPEFAADPTAVTRFVRERTALVKFRHPNVVTLRDMIVEGDRLALVMDLVDGGDLSTYRRSCGGTLPPGEALGLTAQICDALAAAHAAGIVHRDLKPANVLLDAGQVRLADFGIARIVGESPATTTGTIIGTIGFMAPEVISGDEPTPACDVYAVGITLYELLTGVQPFTGQAVTVMHGHLDTLPSRPDGMPDRLWALMSACLSKDPGARPSALVTARALRDPALFRELAAYGQAAPSYGSPYGMSPWAPEGMSGPVTYARPSYASHSGPATASVGLPAMPPSPRPAAGAVSMEAGAAFPATASPETGAAPGWSSPETEVGVVGLGAAGLPPRSGRPAAHRGSHPLRIRPVWAAVAAVVLVSAGVAGTYLTLSGPGAGKSAGPLASPLVAATQSRATLARTASPAASHSPSARATTPSAQPSAPSAPTAIAKGAPLNTAERATPPPVSSAPVGNPGPTGPNLVADGDFTDHTLSAWNYLVLNTAVVSGGARGGYAARMSGNPTAGVTQVISGLKPGKEYELTGWIISDTGNHSTYIGVKDYDSTGGVSRALNNTTWTEAVQTFTPGPGHTTAEVFCWQAVAGTGYCTDVSLKALG